MLFSVDLLSATLYAIFDTSSGLEFTKFLIDPLIYSFSNASLSFYCSPLFYSRFDAESFTLASLRYPIRLSDFTPDCNNPPKIASLIFGAAAGFCDFYIPAAAASSSAVQILGTNLQRQTLHSVLDISSFTHCITESFSLSKQLPSIMENQIKVK